MLKQNKGKDLQKIPKSRLSNGPYYLSKKFDGHYTQIIWDGVGVVEFYTSGGKRFYLADMAEWIAHNYTGEPFHIECEYLFNCNGKLGSRGQSAKLTTYRTEFNKGIVTAGYPYLDKFIVLDRLDMGREPFSARLNSLINLFGEVSNEWLELPEQRVCTLNEAIKLYPRFVAEGYEGGMLKHVNHIYKSGKRTNDIVKLKPRMTGDFYVIEEIEGEGKYEGQIGSLALCDRNNKFVGNVGSGLSDHDRKRWGHFKHKVVEVEFERLDSLLIQPTFKHLRSDKDLKDCDKI